MVDIQDIAKNKNGEWQDFVNYCMDIHDDLAGESGDGSEYRQTKIKNATEAYRVYEQKEKHSNWPWPDASNVVLPLTTITVDNLEPRLVAGITGKKPMLALAMEGLVEQDIHTKILEDWFNDELNRVIKIEDETSTITHKALIEGTVFPIAVYDEDEVVRRDFIFDDAGNIQIDPETFEAYVEDKIDQVFQGGRVEYAELSDIYVADDADDWEAADVIRKIRPTYAELQQNKDKNGWMNIGPWLLSEETRKKLEIDDLSPGQEVAGVEKTGKEVIPCLEFYVDYIPKKEDQTKEDIKDWSSEKYVAVIAKESKVLIRILKLRELNFKNEKPIRRIRLYKEHGKSLGTSIYEKIKSIQDGCSDIFNMVVNVANVTMIPWFMFTSAAGVDPNQALEPGKGIQVDDVSQLYFPKFSQNPRSYIVFIEMFMSLWEKLGSIGDIQIGRLSESRKDATATETMAAIQEGNIKHNYQSVAFKEDFLSLIRVLYDLYYQKMPYDKLHNYKGTPVQIPRKAMNRAYRFRLQGSTDLANKVLEMQKTQQLYQMLLQNPVSNPVKVTEDLVESIKPDAVVEEYINPTILQLLQAMQQNPELPQVIQQYLMNKQTQMATEQKVQEYNQAQTTGKTIADEMLGAMGMRNAA